MSIKSLFRQTSNTIADLQEKYRSILSQKKSLEEQADRLRAESLKSDIPDLSAQLATIQEEINLSAVALSEVERDLQAMIEKKVETDYQGLDAERQEYESQLKNLSQRAGTHLGQAIKTLQTTNYSFARNLAEYIRQQVIDFERDRRFAGQMDSFLKSYSEAINSQSDFDHVNFRDWRKKLLATEKLEPGSMEAKNHIKGRAKRLLAAS